MNKLFIIGLPRTGTTSVSVALLEQGFKVAHTAYTKHAFELADVISDAPCFCDYRELDRLFPGSQFVYLERALVDWVPSMQRLLKKMRVSLEPDSGQFNPVLKRCFNQTFALLSAVDPLNREHLEACYRDHQQAVLRYFSDRNDCLSINVSKPDSLETLMSFLGQRHGVIGALPHLNAGKQVDSWKSFKHPNKINANSAGKDHRQFFDYQSRI